jgi:hypothetical protein
LSAALSAHVLALIASLEHLAGTAMTFLETDAANAAAIATLNAAAGGAAPVAGSAPPAPPIPPDLRAPLPPAVALPPEVISAGVHSGSSSNGEGFITGWQQTASAARDASSQIRLAAAQLPDVLDGPASTPAVTSHLVSYANGLETYAERAAGLARQAGNHAEQHSMARQGIPTPQTMTSAQNRVVTLANANIASGGRYQAALTSAISDKNQLDQQAISNFGDYSAKTESTTGSDDPGDGQQNTPTPAPGQPADPTKPGTANGGPAADPDGSSPLGDADGGGSMGEMMPQMMGEMLSTVSGMMGGVMGGVMKAPEAALQAGSQALGSLTKGLGGTPKMDLPKLADAHPGGLGDPGGAGGGGDPTVPASGGGAPDLGVAPTTGGPPTPIVAPAGATEPVSPAGGSGGGMGSMGMPMGGMGGLGGAPGGGGAGDPQSDRKVQTRNVPHTEDVTGRVDTNRLSAASSASRRERSPRPPDDDGDDSPPETPVVRRLVTRRPEEQ